MPQLQLGSVVPSHGVTMTKEENAKLRKELQEKEKRKRRLPFGFRIERA